VSRVVNVARAGCCRCPNALVASGPDAAEVLLMLLEALESKGWTLDAVGRRVCAACSRADEARARRSKACADRVPAGALEEA
jgi:hypothetical protein